MSASQLSISLTDLNNYQRQRDQLQNDCQQLATLRYEGFSLLNNSTYTVLLDNETGTAVRDYLIVHYTARIRSLHAKSMFAESPIADFYPKSISQVQANWLNDLLTS
jgi:hypothetical protein